MILAGEASGERHGADLIDALRREYADIDFEFFGSGGEKMRRAGAEILVDIKELGIFGMVETARALRKIYQTFRQLRQAALQRQPEAVIFIDWPEFNLRLAKSLRHAALPKIYYISPQIWAWRRYRIRTIKRYIDRMIVILPFEVEFYRRAGMRVEFVGHPLLNSVRATTDRSSFCRHYHLDPHRHIIGLLPGSRRSELSHILPVMMDTMRRLRRAGAQFVLPLAPTISPDLARGVIRTALESVAAGRQLLQPGADAPLSPLDDSTLTLIEHDTYNTLAHCDLAVVTSGTATLEAALLETPMIIVYRSSTLNWHLVRPLLNINTYGLVNLIAGEKIVPELIQKEMNAAGLAQLVLDFLADERKRAAIKLSLQRVKQQLGDGQAAAKAAGIIMRTIGAHPTPTAGVNPHHPT